MTNQEKQKFDENWEPILLKEEVLASGSWYYANDLEHKAELVRETWNYTSFDLVYLDELFGPLDNDFIHFYVGDTGHTYLWRFSREGRTQESIRFSSYFPAKEHIKSYNSRYEIEWASPD